jgi:hypothetical protein
MKRGTFNSNIDGPPVGLQPQQHARRRATRAPSRATMATRLCALALAAATIATLTWATVALESLHQQLHGQGPPLLRYSVRPVGRVNSSYGVAQGYWHLEVNHSFPEPGLVAKARLRKGIGGAGNRSCWEVAQGHAEPYTDFYAPRGSPVQVLLLRFTHGLGRQ